MRPVALRFLAFLLCLVTGVPAQAQCWKRQFPANTPTEMLQQMLFTTPLDGIVVGNGGTIQRTSDGGETWTSLETPTYESLYSVAFGDTLTGWAIGDQGTVLKTLNGGYTWALQAFPDSADLRSVSFRSIDTGYIVGGNYIWRTWDGGATWSRLVTPYLIEPGYIKSFKNNDTVLVSAVGLSGKIWRSIDNGLTWSSYTTPLRFDKIDFATPHVGYAAAYGQNLPDRYFKTVDGGVTWTQVQIQPAPWYSARPYGAIHALDSSNVFIAAGRGGAAASHTVSITSDGGQTWSAPSTNPIDYSKVIYFTSPMNGCIGDMYGGIYLTRDGGVTFTLVNPRPLGSTRSTSIYQFGGIAFSDSLRGIAAGSQTTLRTRDGGITWQVGGAYPSPAYGLKAYMSDSNTGWVITNGNRLMRTVDGGISYTQVASNCNDVRFFSNSFGLLAGPDGLWRTTDGGTTWTIASGLGRPFTSVAFKDSLVWWALGEQDTLFQSIDGGITWTLKPQYNLGIYAPALVGLPNGWLFKAFPTLLRSTDSGNSWTTVLPMYSSFPRLSFADTLHGMINVSNNIYSMSVGPVFLRQTTDGGISWTKMPIRTGIGVEDITYPDTAHAWTCSRGSIFKYFATCPPAAPLQPFADKSAIKSCPNINQVVKVTNWNTYPATDTLVAVLRQGNTIVQTLNIDTSGKIAFNTPSTPGNYTLEIRVFNALHPAGLSRFVAVQILPISTPTMRVTTSALPTIACSPFSFTISSTASSSLGSGYTVELHMIRKNGTDSLVGLGHNQTTLTLTDSCQLYYRVLLGSGVCYGSGYYYSDTFAVNISQPQVASAQLNSLPSTTVCPNKPLSISASAQGFGGGATYTFYSIRGSVVTNIQSGTSSTVSIPSIDTAMRFFALIQAPAGACVTNPTFSSDTINTTLAPTLGIVAHLTTNRSQNIVCLGDTLEIRCHSNRGTIPKAYSFYTFNMSGTSSLLQTGPDSIYRNSPMTSARVYVHVHIPGDSCSDVNSDTVNLTVIPHPPTPSISVVGNTLKATPIVAGAVYTWYLNGQALPGRISDTLMANINGSYTVRMANSAGCISGLSSAFLFQTTGLADATLKEGFYLYPNPTSDGVWLEWKDRPKTITLWSADIRMLTRLVPSSQDDKMFISLSALAPGNYLLRVHTSEGKEWRKIIVKQ